MRINFKRGLTALIVAAVMCLPLSSAVYAQGGGNCALGALAPMTSSADTFTVSSTAVGLTASKYATATQTASYARVNTSAAIRYWDDGSTPTAAVGLPLAAGADFEICGIAAIKAWRGIRQSGDSTVTATYYTGRQ